MVLETHDIRPEDTDTRIPPGEINVHRYERSASAALGAALISMASWRRGLLRAGVLALGAALIHRATTGHSRAYAALRVNTAAPGLPRRPGVRVGHTIVIHRPPAQVYSFWRALENLPIFMHNLEAVVVSDEGPERSRWRARGPAGSSVEWEATLVDDVPGERLAWQTLPDSEVHNAGSVRFAPALDGDATRVTVNLEYDPPGGMFGALVARVLGADPERQIAADLARLKLVLEADLGALQGEGACNGGARLQGGAQGGTLGEGFSAPLAANEEFAGGPMREGGYEAPLEANAGFAGGPLGEGVPFDAPLDGPGGREGAPFDAPLAAGGGCPGGEQRPPDGRFDGPMNDDPFTPGPDGGPIDPRSPRR